MLSTFIPDALDTLIIFCLWKAVNKKSNDNIFKELLAIFIVSVLVTAIEQLGICFGFIYCSAKNYVPQGFNRMHINIFVYNTNRYGFATNTYNSG